MSGKATPIGPFTGGLNNISQTGEAQDTEVVELVNMYVALDGSLSSRAPFLVDSSSLVTTASGPWRVYGIHRVTTEEWYLVVAKPTATGAIIAGYLNGAIKPSPDYVIKTITNYSDIPESSVQYNDNTYFICNARTSGAAVNFKWSPTEGVVDTPSVPKGSKILSWNDRLWVSATGIAGTGNRVRFSDIDETGSKPESWPAINWFDVAAGEGGFITNILVSYNNMIIFKNDGTWKFSYASNPNRNGQVDKVDGYVGAAGPDCVVEFENLIYVYDNGVVYELVNNNFAQVNRKLEFRDDAESFDQLASGVSLSVVNRRLFVQYHSSLYVFTIDTKSWSLWRSVHGTPGKFIELPSDSYEAKSPVFVSPILSQYQSASANLIRQDLQADELQKTCPITLTTGISALIFDVPSGFTDAFTVYFNETGSGLSQYDFDIPVSPGQEFSVPTYTRLGLSVVWRFRFYMDDGTTTTKNAVAGKVVTPAKAIMGRVEAVFTGTGTLPVGATVTFDNIFAKREAGYVSSARMITYQDEYADTARALELINTEVVTKSYDYGQPAYFKRMFMWGADIKAYRTIYSVLTSLGRRRHVTWGSLGSYTYSELSYGTWGSPLAFINENSGIGDSTEIPGEFSENGRYYIKLGRGMRIRFKQVYFVIRTSTLGNRQTGPVKLYGLTTFVDTKATVVAKAT